MDLSISGLRRSRRIADLNRSQSSMKNSKGAHTTIMYNIFKMCVVLFSILRAVGVGASTVVTTTICNKGNFSRKSAMPIAYSTVENFHRVNTLFNGTLFFSKQQQCQQSQQITYSYSSKPRVKRMVYIMSRHCPTK